MVCPCQFAAPLSVLRPRGGKASLKKRPAVKNKRNVMFRMLRNIQSKITGPGHMRVLRVQSVSRMRSKVSRARPKAA